jgi:hypothetical protein
MTWEMGNIGCGLIENRKVEKEHEPSYENHLAPTT